MELDAYDAGILGGDDSCTTEWWRDYLRSELARAHDFYQGQIDSAEKGNNLNYYVQGLVKLLLDLSSRKDLDVTNMAIQRIRNKEAAQITLYALDHPLSYDQIELLLPLTVVYAHSETTHIKTLLFDKSGLLLVERWS